MARWLQLDSKIINLDHVTIISPRTKHGEVNAGTNINFINGDGMYTAYSVDEVLRRIEAAEGPEPPKARITDHDFEGAFGAMYECVICFQSKDVHAR